MNEKHERSKQLNDRMKWKKAATPNFTAACSCSAAAGIYFAGQNRRCGVHRESGINSVDRGGGLRRHEARIQLDEGVDASVLSDFRIFGTVRLACRAAYANLLLGKNIAILQGVVFCGPRHGRQPPMASAQFPNHACPVLSCCSSLPNFGEFRWETEALWLGSNRENGYEKPQRLSGESKRYRRTHQPNHVQGDC